LINHNQPAWPQVSPAGNNNKQEEIMKTSIRKITVLFAVLAAMGSTSVFAASEGPVTADVNALAGLAPVLDLACTDVSFGVWRVPTGARGGTNTVTLTMNGATTQYATGGSGGSIALGSGASAVPAAGVCSLTGSNNAGASDAKLVLSNNTGLSFAGAAVLDRLKPTTDAALSADLSVSTATTSVDANGEASWYIVGVLTIPNSLVTDNYGGYQTASAATATYQYPAP
jgi:hypothetical protein